MLLNKREVKSRLLGSYCLLSLSVIIPIISFYGFLKPESEDIHFWFQRSGSISVLLAIAFEFQLSKITSLIDPTDDYGDSQLRALMQAKFNVFIFKLKIAGVFTAILGAVIWGYGDILYKIIKI